MFQQRMNVGQFTAEINRGVNFQESYNYIQMSLDGDLIGGAQVTEEEPKTQRTNNEGDPDEESHQIDLVAAAKAASKARGITSNKYQMVEKK